MNEEICIKCGEKIPWCDCDGTEICVLCTIKQKGKDYEYW